jgi:hypothetical protein
VDIGLITPAIPAVELHDCMRCRALRQMPLESCRVSRAASCHLFLFFRARAHSPRTLSPRLRLSGRGRGLPSIIAVQPDPSACPLYYSHTSLVSLPFTSLPRVRRPYPAALIPCWRRPKPCSASCPGRPLYHRSDFSSYHTTVTSIDSDSRYAIGHCGHLTLLRSPSWAERILLRWPHR